MELTTTSEDAVRVSVWVCVYMDICVFVFSFKLIVIQKNICFKLCTKFPKVF